VEAHVGLLLDESLDQLRDTLEQRRRRGVANPETEDDPALFHALVVVDAAAGQIGVGEDDLLPPKGADACRAQAYLLDRPELRADDDEIAELERAIEVNRQRSEDV